MKHFTKKLIMSVLTIMGVQQLSAQVTINETNFPDEAFRSFVSRYFDTDTDNELSSSEIANAKVMDLSWIYVSDLKGIEYFTALTELDCRNSYLITLDVSKNVALEKLDCRGNDLTSLDLSSNTALTYLDCYSNDLTSLDLSNNTALTDLDCSSNDLTSLDLSSNTALTYLDCSSNYLTSLDLFKNTALEDLYCSNNKLTTLNVSNNVDLTDLYCYNNQLSSIDLSNNTELVWFKCYDNQLSYLNISNNMALKELYCQNNKLTTLDLSNNQNLKYLKCNSNDLTALNLINNTSLVELNCNDNHLTSLDLSENKDLELDSYWNEFDCSDNTYTAKIDETYTFDLSTLPGHFDHTRMTITSGNAVENDGILKVDEDSESDTIKVTYKYMAREDITIEYTLNLIHKDGDGVPYIKSGIAFYLYPNPAIEYVSVSVAGDYKIYNINGTLLQSGTTEKDEEINISNLVPGSYLFEMGGSIKKLIVK